MRYIPIRRSFIAMLVACMVFGSPVAVAQTLQAPSPGITVTGQGRASGPADTATLQLSVATLNFGPPSAPRPDATPGAAERESVVPIVEALVNAGVAESDIRILVPPFLGDAYGTYAGPALAVLTLPVSEPSAESIVRLVDVATVAAAGDQLLIGGLGITYTVTDCAPLQREAREAAMNDARDKAGVQAELMNVSLGDIVASRDVVSGAEMGFSPYGTTSSGGECTAMITPNFYGPGAPTFDPAGETEVTVYSALEMTFGIEGSREATPAT